jgi:hypothetical protein
MERVCKASWCGRPISEDNPDGYCFGPCRTNHKVAMEPGEEKHDANCPHDCDCWKNDPSQSLEIPMCHCFTPAELRDLHECITTRIESLRADRNAFSSQIGRDIIDEEIRELIILRQKIFELV